MNINFTVRTALFLMASLICMSNVAAAQTLDPYYARLNELNQIKPYQNPRWDRLERVQKNAIVDNKNKVIGSLTGITLAQNGTVQALNVDLDRLQLGRTTLNYNAMRIKSGSASYILGFDDGAIKDNYAALLANVEPASGDDGLLNAKALKGASIEVSDGRRIGRVEEIMFTARNDRAEAIVSNINYKGVRANSLAIPFATLNFYPVGNSYKVILTPHQADALLQFASK